MLIQFAIFTAVYTFDLRNTAIVKHLFTRRIFLAQIILFVVLTTFSFLITGMGAFMGLNSEFIIKTPFYFLLTIVPAFAFVVSYLVMFTIDKGNRKSSKGDKTTVKMPNKRK